LFHHAIGQVVDRLEALGGWALAVIALLIAAMIAVKWAQRVSFYRRLRLARVMPADLKEMMDRGEPVMIVDVRTRAARKGDPRHIPQALIATPEEISAARHAIEGKEIVLYCT
jgi:hypothetical protein